MFTIAGRELESRLILGTGGFRNLSVMAEAAEESGAELATVAMRRVDPERARLDRRGALGRRARGAAEHGRLLHGARRGRHREARP